MAQTHIWDELKEKYLKYHEMETQPNQIWKATEKKNGTCERRLEDNRS